MTEDAELAALASDFDHVSLTFRDRRLEFYAYLAEHREPVRWSSKHGGFWFVSTYDEALAAQRMPEAFSNKDFTIPRRPVPPLIPATLDPPEHAGYKRLLSTYFTPTVARAMEPGIVAIADRLLDEGIARGRLDVVNEMMLPLMSEFSMALMLGLPVEKALPYAEPIHHMTRRDYPHDKAAAEMTWLAEAMLSDIREGRIDPNGILGRLRHAAIDGRELNDHELLMIAINLLIGGMGTTSFFMGSVVVFLGRNSAHRRQLIADPALIPDAIEELLRVFTPTQSFGRSVPADIEFAGTTIRKGDMLLIGYGAANFDPAVFDDPQRIDFSRKQNRHMSFGNGPHRCLGIHIARMMATTATRLLLEKAPDFRLVEDEVVEQDEFASMFGFNTVPIVPDRKAGTHR
jgi:cytochrome P450